MAIALLAAAALASSLSAHTPEAAPLRMAANGNITFRACNHTKTAVLLAGSWIPVYGSKWQNRGWMTINAGACGDVFVTANRTFYARAEVKGHADQSWGNDIKQCAEYPGPYNFFTGSDDTSCPEGEPADFATFHSDGRSVYVWNLTP
ncbi:MAG TPA: DUF1036 domain-containing protein [Rhizomicrobium sp.]|jgi:uncharacterized membrane protein|nr:DUF1036 domain-containing protein [Rhizomicrobium sp.]